MRIAHIDTERTWRGGQQQVYSLIQGLTKKGHTNVSVVWKNGALSERLKLIDEQIYEVKPCGELNFWTGHFLNRFLKEHKIDIVHAHAPHATALGAIATLGTSIPFVITRRVDFPLSSSPLSRWKYNRAKRIIAISHGVKKVLLDSGIAQEKIDLVPSGVDFSRYETVSVVTPNEMQVPRDAVVIGQVAALAPHKDQQTLLRALSLLKDKFPKVHLVFVGEGEERNNLEEETRKLQLQERVHFLGFQERPLNFLMTFDVFCLSSKSEGLGTSLLDAMALRVPVVATRAGGIPELIEDGKTGYLAEPQNPQNLAQVLEKALKQKEETKSLCEAAYQKARQYDIINTITGTEKIYTLSTGLSTL